VTAPVGGALPDLRWDDRGLLPAIVQDAGDGGVLMLAWMNREALERTLAGPHVTFWSRSRGALWTKGDTSGHRLETVAVRADCDGDALLVTARPTGPACHTGARSCFFAALSPGGPPARPGEVLAHLCATIEARRGADPAASWTARLLTAGPDAVGAKLREEAGELAAACASEPDDRVAAEAADLVYHLLVALAGRGVPLSRVTDALAAREGRSGLEEKASRPAQGDPTVPDRNTG